jgi:hypothetical protein
VLTASGRYPPLADVDDRDLYSAGDDQAADKSRDGGNADPRAHQDCPLWCVRCPRHLARKVVIAIMDACVLAALRYAAAGIAVLPLHTPTDGVCSCRQGPLCASPGKHPRLRHGVREASTDARMVRLWWRRWRGANVGLATGGALEVCDTDTNTALQAVLDLWDVVRPPGPVVRTGNGWHLWIAGQGLPSRVRVLPDVDWRGAGGLVVAPPSRHATGARYRFTQPWTGTLPPCPPQLRGLVLPPQPPTVTVTQVVDVNAYARAALDGEVGRILRAVRPVYRPGRRVRAGGRNSALNVAAFRLGQLAGTGGLDAATVWPALTHAALAVGLTPAETRATIASGWRAGLQHPRRAGSAHAR